MFQSKCPKVRFFKLRACNFILPFYLDCDGQSTDNTCVSLIDLYHFCCQSQSLHYGVEVLCQTQRSTHKLSSTIRTHRGKQFHYQFTIYLILVRLGCALFSMFFGHNPVLVDLSELSTVISSFWKLYNVYTCLQAIFVYYNYI